MWNNFVKVDQSKIKVDIINIIRRGIYRYLSGIIDRFVEEFGKFPRIFTTESSSWQNSKTSQWHCLSRTNKFIYFEIFLRKAIQIDKNSKYDFSVFYPSLIPSVVRVYKRAYSKEKKKPIRGKIGSDFIYESFHNT